jgi:hypothetical protein
MGGHHNPRLPAPLVSYVGVHFESQRSPANTASIAGAWNALHDLHRHHEQALKQADVTEVYKEIMAERVRTAAETCVQRLCVHACACVCV